MSTSRVLFRRMVPLLMLVAPWSWQWLAADEPKARAAFTEATMDVVSLAFSPDGKILASGNSGGIGNSKSKDSTIKLWGVASGKCVATLEGYGRAKWLKFGVKVAFRPDGKMLASASSGDKTIKLWDVASSKTTATLQHENTQGVNSLAFSPDGKTLATGSGHAGKHRQTIKLWEVASGKNTATLEGHTATVASLAFSPDGTMLVSCGWDKTVKLWHVASGKNIATFQGHTDPWVWAVAFSPDGKTVASGSGKEDKSIKLWDVATAKEKVAFVGHTDRIFTLAFSPDGTILASGGGEGAVRLWDMASGKSFANLDHSGRVRSVAFSPDGKVVASGGGAMIKLWDVPPAPRNQE